MLSFLDSWQNPFKAESGQIWTKVEEQPQKTPVDSPRGFFSAHVDDKGRLKLPVELQQYFTRDRG